LEFLFYLFIIRGTVLASSYARSLDNGSFYAFLNKDVELDAQSLGILEDLAVPEDGVDLCFC
jgi:hypothetical protein